MDKSEGNEGESSKKQFDLNNFPEEEKDDDGVSHNDSSVGENFPQSSPINQELGLKTEEEIKRENSGDVHVPQSVHQPEVVNDVTDSVEQNPDVEFGRLINRDVQNQRNRPQSQNHADQIGSTGQIGSSSHGTMSYQGNVLGQGIDGTRLLLNLARSSLGPMQLNKNDSAELGLHAPDAPIVVFKNMNLSRYVDSSFFIPRGVHEHNMRIRSRLDMFREFRRPPRVQMVPPMVEMRPPMIETHPPRVEIPPPMVQMVPPMVQMRPPVVQMGSHRGVVHDPTSPSTDINMAVRSGGEQGGRIGEAKRSQDRSQHNDEHGSTSRDAKRSRR